MKLWNHYKTASINDTTVHYPHNEEELVSLIKTAHQEKRKVRVMGASHSQMGIMYCEEMNISLTHYNKILTISGTTVSIQAGINITQLNAQLSQHNLSLSNFGSSAHPTFVGLMLAGSHGGSLKYGTVASTVTALRLIQYDGSILSLKKGDELFDAVVVSIGILGVISTVTFETMEGALFSSHRYLISYEELLEKYGEITQKNDYVRCLWYPITGDVEVWSANRLPAFTAHNAVTHDQQYRVCKLDLFLAPYVIFFISHFKRFQRTLSKQFVRTDAVRLEGNATEIFAVDDGGNPLFYETGIAVSHSDTLSALATMLEHFQKTDNFPIFPIEFRPCPADNLWLSAAYKRDITAFAILAHRHGKCDHDRFYTEVRTLLKPYNYRIHWGMWITESTEYLSTQYEHWNDFLNLQTKMDPDFVFEQPILKKLFGYTH